MSRAVATLGPAVTAFAEGSLVYPEGEKAGLPFKFDEFQREDVDLIFEVDEDGLPCWQMVVWGMPTGSGKSPACAVFALFALFNSHGRPQVLCAAAAREQAGIVHKHAGASAQGGPARDYLEFPRSREALGPILYPSNNGVLRVLSADGALQEGLNPSFVSIDELHSFLTKKQQSLFTALSTKLHKRPDSRMVIITTAGESKDSLLGELYDAIIERGNVEYQRDGCKIIARDYAAKRLLIWYGAPESADVKDPKVWRACNPATWIPDSELLVAANREPESVFRRYFLNQWVKGENAAIQPASWDACFEAGAGLPEKGADLWLGVDNGGQRDTGAVSWLSPRADSRLIVGAFVHAAQEGQATAAPLIENELRELYRDYNVKRVGYDKWQVADMVNRLSAEGYPLVECSQKNDVMVPASQLTFDLINERTLVHDGDKALRLHVLGTGAEITATGGWRFVKAKTKTGARDLTKNNDACIALAMAVYGWREDTTRPPEPVPSFISLE